MYTLRLTTRQIQNHLKDLYAVDLSPALISLVTDKVTDLVSEGRSRLLEPQYLVLFLDALRVNIRDRAAVVKKSLYVALILRLDGQNEGGQNEGASNLWFPFWMGSMNELKNRGWHGYPPCHR
ncbi:hypothetical protein Holit_03407 [Hollandina sp. SP2]